MKRIVVSLVFVFALLVAIGGLGVVAQEGNSSEPVDGEPDLEVYLPDRSLSAGEEAELTVQIANDGRITLGSPQNRDAVTAARNVRVELDEDDAPIEVKSGKQAVGTVTESEPRQTAFRVSVPDNAEPGTYELTVDLEYSYTELVFATTGKTSDVTTSTTETVEITIDEQARFAVHNASTTAQVGGEGTVELEMENVGNRSVTDARVMTESTSSRLMFGESPTDETYVGSWEPGENRTIVYDATVHPDASVRSYTLDSTIQFRDEGGERRAEDGITAGVTPLATQSISIDEFEDTLAVGYDGVIRGTISNDGPATISDGVLTIEPASDSLFIEESRYALPPLEPGEQTEFAFPADVSGGADPGPRQVSFFVEYTNGGQSTVQAGPVRERVEIGPSQPEFSLTDLDVQVTAGETSTATFEITNDRPETLSNINARIYTDSPLSSGTNEAFVSELEPGESAEIVFELGAARNAMSTTYPVELDFQYQTERGETTLSRTYYHPIDVAEATDDGDEGGLPIGAIAFGSIALLGGTAAVFWWYRRE